MKKVRIIADDNIPYLRGRLEAVADVEYCDQFGFTPGLVSDADAIMIRTRTRCDRALLGDSHVSLIATATIGMDQIDRDWCAQSGIEVCNAPGCNAPGVAQYVWSAMLRMGFDPARHTLGVVGCGNVGGIVARWGEQLGARVLISDPPRQEAGLKVPGQYVSLEELLRESDAVTLHTPLTLDGRYPTHHLIGAREFGVLSERLTEGRKPAIFVNAARGGVVDFRELKPAVLGKRIRAVIDTWEGEPQIDAELLGAVEYGTFHIAGYSRQGKQRATRMALEAVERHFGVSVDMSGLEGEYRGTPGLSAEKILASYDPADDTSPLREDPAAFDTLRRNYTYREEV